MQVTLSKKVVKKSLVPYAYIEGSSEGELSIADLRNFVSSTDAAIILTMVRRELSNVGAQHQALAVIDRIAKALGEIEVSLSESLQVEAFCGFSTKRSTNDVFHSANSLVENCLLNNG